MEVTIPLATRDEALALFGLGDRNLKYLRDRLGLKVAARDNVVRLIGDKEPLEVAADVLNNFLRHYRDGAELPDDFVERELARRGAAAEVPLEPVPGPSDPVPPADPEAALQNGGEATTAGGPRRPLSPEETSLVSNLSRTPGQGRYIEAMLRNELTFCIGPAGTGKTYLAVHMAVHFLREGAIRRLVLCRPAVEAGEKLGFLPGDFQAKVNPYLRPLYDALHDVLGFEQVKRYLEREIIEILPLAYMRGRTLNHAFIILDEGQNTTISQMKMFLTRMGSSSRIVVNGDITQIDLPAGQPSGLVHAQKVIRDVPGIAWSRLRRPDIVRHRLVQRIVEAYEADERERSRQGEKVREGRPQDSRRGE